MRMTELRPVQCCVTTMPARRATTALTRATTALTVLFIFLATEGDVPCDDFCRGNWPCLWKVVIGMMDWIASFMPAGFNALHIVHAACPPAEDSIQYF